jgi:protein PhnA
MAVLMSAYSSVQTCRQQVEDPEKTDVQHWRCLNESTWSQVPAVQVIAWRMLKRLSTEGWAQGLLNMLFLEVIRNRPRQ